MACLRFTDLQSRPLEFLDFTSLTLDEFQQLVPPFETAFHARMAAWRMDGKPRTARRFTVYKNGSDIHVMLVQRFCVTVDQKLVYMAWRSTARYGHPRGVSTVQVIPV